MEQQPIHYRTGGKLTHAGCECLPNGKDIEYIVISWIEYKAKEKINGRTEENVWIAHFAPNPYTKLPMILNATNRKRIAKLFPDCNGYINMLKNIPVRLTREVCRDAQDGGDTWGLRISKIPAKVPVAPAAPAPAKPKEKPFLTPENEEKWNGAIDFLRQGKTMEEIRKYYQVSPENEAALLNAVKVEEI